MNRRKPSGEQNQISPAVFVIMLIAAMISIYPLIWVILQSFKTESEFLRSIWSLPSSLNLDNYVKAFEEANLLTYLKNTVINTSATLAVDLVLITCLGYAFSKLKMKFKKFFYYMILINMLIPTPIILLPMYLQVVNLGIQNTLAAIVFPYYQGFAPLGLILIKNYMDNIPDEIIESAKMDGCGTYRILWSIMVPLVKPMLVTLAILGGMNAWNEYMWALVSISDTSKYTLSVGIAVIRDKIATIGYTPVFAALTVSAMVFVVIYLFAQKTFVRSITAGAVKG
ncbi:MAG: carbohydrate ABC transporter permease [Ruminococcus sp.]|uniref:Carbohydrate ABC transporter permease n=1 Tax=Schaedlerella arabinosiphila TaxID=2044587 RepID=A0A3R8JTU2_9FIRM|nr:carbohydrate ABC transporter permease [Schaedlerella arabinosiphila]MCI8723009.1 carbohydrate ABC transporter permease [Ruminococcus sp.]RRK35372.1 carbohydrate ABC transporter permease [Schaedlerella arabinosiphila]